MSISDNSAGAVRTPTTAEQLNRRPRRNDTWEKLEDISDRIIQRMPDPKDRT